MEGTIEGDDRTVRLAARGLVFARFIAHSIASPGGEEDNVRGTQPRRHRSAFGMR
jgi:hypothetical protein